MPGWSIACCTDAGLSLSNTQEKQHRIQSTSSTSFLSYRLRSSPDQSALGLPKRSIVAVWSLGDRGDQLTGHIEGKSPLVNPRAWQPDPLPPHPPCRLVPPVCSPGHPTPPHPPAARRCFCRCHWTPLCLEIIWSSNLQGQQRVGSFAANG